MSLTEQYSCSIYGCVSSTSPFKLHRYMVHVPKCFANLPSCYFPKR